MKTLYVYMMTNKNNTTVYVGVTSDLPKRVWEHKQNMFKGFTSRYNLTKLVYFEVWQGELEAIEREKYLKRCYRKTKNKLIAQNNPNWNDLYENMVEN